MYKFLQRNGKKILAILGVFLMVAFIVPPAAKYNQTRARRVVGHLGSQKVYNDELADAREEVDLLMNRMGREGQMLVFQKVGGGVFMELQRRPELFFLLEQESHRAGIVASDDMANTVLTNQLLAGGAFVRNEQMPAARNAVRHLIEIGVLHDRLVSGVKISEPLVVREGAAQWEAVRLNLVTLATSDAGTPTTLPTTQQVQEQFDQFKNVQANSSMRPGNDPLGFGYEVPNRVKLQYIAVPRKMVEEAVRAGKSAYDWEVASRMYYAEHSSEFFRNAPVTQPASAPSTQPTTAALTQPATSLAVATTQPSTHPDVAATQPAIASTQPALASTQPATTPAIATSGPSTRPFEEVKEEIIQKLLAPDVDKLASDITAAVAQRLATGWQAFESGSSASAGARPSTQPSTNAATAPATQPAGYDTYAFLQSAAADIFRQFKVLPEVHQLGEWEDASQLAKEPGIGAAHTPEGRDFSQYATEDAIALNATTQSSGAPRLHLLEPSLSLSDTAKNDYIFRLTAASPAHSPDLQEIHARVEDDARLKWQYQNQVAEARKLLDDAQKQGLSAAAVAAHRPVTSVGPFRFSDRMIPNFIANPAATAALIGKARALLEEATPDHPHPVALVEMPSERKVVVAELADVILDAREPEIFADKLRAFTEAQMSQADRLSQKWFSYDAVAARLDYRPEAPEKSQSAGDQ